MPKNKAMQEEGQKTKEMASVAKTSIILTIANLVGFVMIGPFTSYTLFLGIPAGCAAILFTGWQVLVSVNYKRRFFAGLLVVINIFILYLTLDYL